MENYDLVIIGGGVGGLVAASGAAQLGARVALVEKKDSLGGDCLHSGCVPTKRLIYSAKVASMVNRAREFGIESGPAHVNFPAVMEGMRGVQAKLGEHDDPERFRKMGVEVIFGGGAFSDSHTFTAGGRALRGRKFLIATGSGPVIIPIPGLKESGVLTNETALRLKNLPSEIVILGAGPIGIEFAQVFSRLGSKVTIVEKMGQILPREDKEVSDTLQLILEKEGIKIDTCTEVTDVKSESGRKCISAACETGKKSYNPDEVMIAIGRAPHVEGLGLEAAGVEYDKRHGIKADRTLRTTAKHIYACGDVIGHFAFTHMAEYQASIVVSNALFPFVSRKVNYSSVPWVTYCDPELARVGLTEEESRAKYGNVGVYRFYFKDVDRAVIEGEGHGLIKLITDKKNRILGAHILGPHAGEMIHEYVLAKQAGLPITSISKTIHVYPTIAQGVKRAADQYYAEKLFKGWFPKVARWLIRRGG